MNNQTRSAIILHFARLETHMRIAVRDRVTQRKHFLLLHPTNIVLTCDDLITYDRDAVIDSLMNSTVAELPLPRIHLTLNRTGTKLKPIAAVLV